MIQFEDTSGRPVFVNAHHVKILTDDGDGGTTVWFEWPDYTARRMGAYVRVAEDPKLVAKTISQALETP